MALSREPKFGYGFLLAGVGLAYLIDKLLFPVTAIISAAVCLVVGVGFLVAAHFHKEKTEVRQRGLMATIGLFAAIGAASGALIGGLSGAIWSISHTKPREASGPPKSTPLPPDPAPKDTLPGPGPELGTVGSVTTLLTPKTPKGGAMSGGFTTSGRGDNEIDIFGVPPEEVLFKPPNVSVERGKLPTDLLIDGHKMTVRKFTDKGFVIFDNGWRDVPITVSLVKRATTNSNSQTHKSAAAVAYSSKPLKKPDTVVPQTINNYVTEIPWGNLKERAFDLVHDLRLFIKERKYYLETSPRYAPPLTAEKFKDWDGQSDNLYNSSFSRYNFPSREKILQEEFAKHSLIDPALDKLLSDYSEELKKPHDDPFRHAIGLYAVEEIANRFENLAKRVPD